MKDGPNRTVMAVVCGIFLVVGFAVVSQLTRRERPVARPPAQRLGPVAGRMAPSNSAAADLAHGEALFARNCVMCHGSEGRGSQVGPALVNKIYAPGHHADEAFLLAVQRGVKAHHWKFGDMPPVPNVSPEQVKLITAYIRSLQKKAGFF